MTCLVVGFWGLGCFSNFPGQCGPKQVFICPPVVHQKYNSDMHQKGFIFIEPYLYIKVETAAVA